MAARAKPRPRKRPGKVATRTAAARPARRGGPPKGFHTLTPELTVRGGLQALDFYKRAFGAAELMRMPGPDGASLMHAELRIGDSIFFVSDETPEMGNRSPQALGGTPASFYVYVDDVDRAFARAVNAGAQVRMPVTNMFWGDRYGRLVDPFGHEWGLATRKEDLTPAQQRQRAAAFFSKTGR